MIAEGIGLSWHMITILFSFAPRPLLTIWYYYAARKKWEHICSKGTKHHHQHQQLSNLQGFCELKSRFIILFTSMNSENHICKMQQHQIHILFYRQFSSHAVIYITIKFRKFKKQIFAFALVKGHGCTPTCAVEMYLMSISGTLNEKDSS